MDKKQNSENTPAETVKPNSNAKAMEDLKNSAHKLQQAEGEIGGPSGLEPTRYGDWERKGIVSDF